VAEQVKGMPVLVVHGDSDWVVPVELVWCTRTVVRTGIVHTHCCAGMVHTCYTGILHKH
jgi:predicted esterase